MTITSLASCSEHHLLWRTLLLGALALAPLGAAGAWQSTTTTPIKPAPRAVVIAPSPNAQFQQQSMQQQQLRDQLQKSQLEQQLRQGVADNARRPSASDPGMQQQLDQADRARQDLDRAQQQELLNRQNAAALPRVLPQSRPASARSGG